MSGDSYSIIFKDNEYSIIRHFEYEDISHYGIRVSPVVFLTEEKDKQLKAPCDMLNLLYQHNPHLSLLYLVHLGWLSQFVGDIAKLGMEEG